MKTAAPFKKINLLLPAILLTLFGLGLPGFGRTMNGNDFALYYSEAKTVRERSALMDEARGNPHFFRYLQIMELEKKEQDGRTVYEIVAFEPSSLMDVSFTISRSISKKKIDEEPESKRGSALAVTGKVSGVDDKANTILLDSVIVRHKDRLSPAVGKEMLFEVMPGAAFYSYTGWKRSVSLSYRDRDLLKHKSTILGGGGPQAWVEFLEREVAKRKKARAAKAKGAGQP